MDKKLSINGHSFMSDLSLVGFFSFYEQDRSLVLSKKRSLLTMLFSTFPN